MKKREMRSGLLLAVILIAVASCSVRIPEEYRSHACADFCYMGASEEADEEFAARFGLTDKYIKEIDKPVCRNYREMPDGEEAISYLCAEDTALRPMSPACGGCDTFCDCLMKDNSYASEKAIKQ